MPIWTRWCATWRRCGNELFWRRAGMSSDAMAIRTAEAAGGHWLETLHEWGTTVDHKRVGVLYILYALFFFVIRGLEAIVIRIQFLRPPSDLVFPPGFNPQFPLSWPNPD